MTWDEAKQMLSVTKEKAKAAYDKGELIEAIANSPNLHKMRYTYLHRQAIFKLAKEFELNPDDYMYHDTDKYFMYLFEEETKTREAHRLMNIHHHYSLGPSLTKEVLIEMMLDWESARFTKPDKPYNAYDTLQLWMPAVMHTPMIQILQEFQLDHPTNDDAITMEAYLEIADAVSPEMIQMEILLSLC